MRQWIIGLAALLFIASALPAWAQSRDQQWGYCVNQNGQHSLDLMINGCTAIIESGQETDANLAIAFYNRGNAHDDMKDYGRAIADYGQAIRLNLQSSEVFFNRGVAYKHNQELTLAIADYDEAIRLNPQDASIYLNRGVAHRAKQDLTSAMADFEEAIRLNPQYAKAYSNRGGVYRAKQDFTRAIADYDEAIRLNPQLPQPYYGRGKSLIELGKTAEGEADITKAKALGFTEGE